MSLLHDLGALAVGGYALLAALGLAALASERVGSWRDHRWARRALSAAVVPTPDPGLTGEASCLVGEAVEALLGAVGLVTSVERVDLFDAGGGPGSGSVRVEVTHPSGTLHLWVHRRGSFVLVDSERLPDGGHGAAVHLDGPLRPTRRFVSDLVHVVTEELAEADRAGFASNEDLRGVEALLVAAPEGVARELLGADLLGGLGGEHAERGRALGVATDLTAGVPAEWVLRRARAAP